MASDDKDAEESRSYETSPKIRKLFRQVSVLFNGQSKKEQSTQEIFDNRNPFRAIDEEIQNLEPKLVNDSIRELETNIKSVRKSPSGNDKVLQITKDFQKLAMAKSLIAQPVIVTSLMERTDSRCGEVRAALLANLELGYEIQRPPYDEDMFLHYHKADPRLTGTGLGNLGETCFMNSVLQCLVHTVPFYEAILSENHSFKCTCNTESGFCLPCTMPKLCRSSTSGRSAIAPLTLANNLRYISDRFSRHKQEDADEFLQKIWAQLKDDNSSDENIIKEVFGGSVFSNLKCLRCGSISSTTLEIYDMQLPINQDTDSLMIAIHDYTMRNVPYSCDDCRTKEGAMLKVVFRKLPSIATFQLKRFGNEMNKIEKDVSFPLVLDMLYFFAGATEMKYQLYGVTGHEGLSLKEGHFYCFIQISPDQWIKFDNPKVSRVEQKEVLSQQAYILFYAKAGTPWFLDSIKEQEPEIPAADAALSCSTNVGGSSGAIGGGAAAGGAGGNDGGNGSLPAGGNNPGNGGSGAAAGGAGDGGNNHGNGGAGNNDGNGGAGNNHGTLAEVKKKLEKYKEAISEQIELTSLIAAWPNLPDAPDEKEDTLSVLRCLLQIKEAEIESQYEDLQRLFRSYLLELLPFPLACNVGALSSSTSVGGSSGAIGSGAAAGGTGGNDGGHGSLPAGGNNPGDGGSGAAAGGAGGGGNNHGTRAEVEEKREKYRKAISEQRELMSLIATWPNLPGAPEDKEATLSVLRQLLKTKEAEIESLYEDLP